MSYYPKTKIKEDLYTGGKEFELKSNNKPYSGYYYALSNNTFFTGKTPDDPTTTELIKISSLPQSSTFIVPNYFYPQPSEKDYKIGFLTRYFMKKRIDNFTSTKEISPNDYNKNFGVLNTDSDLYVAVKLNWKITGDKNSIINTNQQLVKLKEGVIPGFSLLFKDFSQFSRPA